MRPDLTCAKDILALQCSAGGTFYEPTTCNLLCARGPKNLKAFQGVRARACVRGKVLLLAQQWHSQLCAARSKQVARIKCELDKIKPPSL